jgi:hypothetical protein
LLLAGLVGPRIAADDGAEEAKVTRVASATQPAKLLAIFVAPEDATLTVPEN